MKTPGSHMVHYPEKGGLQKDPLVSETVEQQPGGPGHPSSAQSPLQAPLSQDPKTASGVIGSQVVK